jgi:hypothetical protein
VHFFIDNAAAQAQYALVPRPAQPSPPPPVLGTFCRHLREVFHACRKRRSTVVVAGISNPACVFLFVFQGVRLAQAQRTWANPVVYHPIFQGISPPLREIPPGIALTQNVRPLRHPFPLLPMTSFNDPVAQTGLSRWGDYTAISIDPTNDCTFWYTDEYLQQSGSFNWSTRIASFSFPSCGGTVSTATQTSLVSSLNPSSYGQSVTLTATVTSPGGTPTGTVTFYDGGVSLGSAPLSSGGQASLATSTLAAGTHSITAAYSGDSTFTGSTTNVLSQTVNKDATATSLASSLNPAKYGQTVTFTATVTPSAATGTVTFLNGSTAMGTVVLSSGQAQFSTSFKQGTYSITAAYNGNTTFAGSTSPVVTEKVTRK